MKRLHRGGNAIPNIRLQRAICRGLRGTRNMSSRSRGIRGRQRLKRTGYPRRPGRGTQPCLRRLLPFCNRLQNRSFVDKFLHAGTSSSGSTLQTSVIMSENASSAIVFCRDSRSPLVALNSSQSFSARAFSPDRPAMRSCKVLTSRAS